MDLLQNICKKASLANKRIVLPEGEEPRSVEAAAKIATAKIAKVTLIADEDIIKKKYSSINLKDVNIFDPKKNSVDKYVDRLFELRKKKRLTREDAVKLVANPLYLGTLMLECGDADGMVAGAINSTGDVLRPALQIIKTAPGISTVSSCFIMIMPKGSKYGQDGVMVFGDCAVMPNPNAEQLADIAIASAASAKSICGIEPKVAMLSFSTKGSAKHELVDKVVEATALAKKYAPDLDIDGELQADAALVESVGKLKSPDSAVAGKANVLIFPDLASGNIGYKLVQRLAGAEAVGPICQGLNKPVNDLSRGCSVEDIVNVVAMTALQCK